MDEYYADEPVAEESVAEELIVEDPAADEVAGEPAAEEVADTFIVEAEEIPEVAVTDEPTIETSVIEPTKFVVKSGDKYLTNWESFIFVEDISLAKDFGSDMANSYVHYMKKYLKTEAEVVLV
jgi:hypothetical protein